MLHAFKPEVHGEPFSASLTEELLNITLLIVTQPFCFDILRLFLGSTLSLREEILFPTRAISVSAFKSLFVYQIR